MTRNLLMAGAAVCFMWQAGANAAETIPWCDRSSSLYSDTNCREAQKRKKAQDAAKAAKTTAKATEYGNKARAGLERAQSNAGKMDPFYDNSDNIKNAKKYDSQAKNANRAGKAAGAVSDGIGFYDARKRGDVGDQIKYGGSTVGSVVPGAKGLSTVCSEAYKAYECAKKGDWAGAATHGSAAIGTGAAGTVGAIHGLKTGPVGAAKGFDKGVSTADTARSVGNAVTSKGVDKYFDYQDRKLKQETDAKTAAAVKAAEERRRQREREAAFNKAPYSSNSPSQSALKAITSPIQQAKPYTPSKPSNSTQRPIQAPLSSIAPAAGNRAPSSSSSGSSSSSRPSSSYSSGSSSSGSTSKSCSQDPYQSKCSSNSSSFGSSSTSSRPSSSYSSGTSSYGGSSSSSSRPSSSYSSGSSSYGSSSSSSSRPSSSYSYGSGSSSRPSSSYSSSSRSSSSRR